LKDPDAVANGVIAFARSPLHHQASLDGPPPRPGEDL
jgi:hypothetical protein